jgi:hypothetical protein
MVQRSSPNTLIALSERVEFFGVDLIREGNV